MWWILCSDRHFQEGKLPLSDSLKAKIAGEKLLLFFPSHQVCLQSDPILSSDAFLSFSKLNEFLLPEFFKTSAFATHELVRFDDDYLERGKHFSSQTLFAEFRKSTESFCFTLFDPKSEDFQNARISFQKWQSFQVKIDEITRQASLSLKTLGKKAFRNNLEILGRETSSFLKNCGVKIPNAEFRALKILYRGVDEILPLDFLSENLLCFHQTLSKKTDFPKKGKRSFLHLYSRELSSAKSESKALSLKLRDFFDYSLFSLENRENYSGEIQNAQIIHFSGHGKSEDHQGLLKWKEFETVFDTGKTLLTVLNACSGGANLSGVVQSALQSGSCFVVASPFEIPDEPLVDFARLYPHFDAENPEGSLLFWSLLDPDFRMIFRLFSQKLSS